jgi:multiple sugar transport system substrate-binding protein
MYEKETGLIDAFLRGSLSRRDLVKGLAALGTTTATAGLLMNMAQTKALAADFNWKKHSGKTVKLLLNKHPYADAMIANLENFKALTGIDVKYDVFPEDVYFDKVTAALSSSSSEYDAFMTGAYMTWTYGPAKWIEDLNQWIKDPAKTNPNYNWSDMLEGVRSSCAWNGVPGGALGSADAKQWCIPWGYEQNNLAYNSEMFKKAGLSVPKNLDELVSTAKAAKDKLGGPMVSACAAAARGQRSTPASCRPTPTSARRTSTCRRTASCRRP